MTFTVYDASTAGAVKWTQVLTPVTIINGYFSVELGPVAPSVFDGNRWVGFKIGSGTEITPRTAVSSVPFALNADTALTANSANYAAFATQVPWGGVIGAPTSIVTGSGSAGRLTVWNGSGQVSSNSGLSASGSSLTVAGGVNVGSASGAAAGDLKISGSISQSTALGARVYASTSITATSGSLVYIPFALIRTDPKGIRDPNDNTKLVARATGFYLLDCQVRFTASSSTAQSVRAVSLYVNGMEIAGNNVIATNQVVQMSSSTVYSMTVGQYAQCTAWQNSGDTLYLTPWNQRSVEFSMVRIP